MYVNIILFLLIIIYDNVYLPNYNNVKMQMTNVLYSKSWLNILNTKYIIIKKIKIKIFSYSEEINMKFLRAN